MNTKAKHQKGRNIIKLNYFAVPDQNVAITMIPTPIITSAIVWSAKSWVINRLWDLAALPVSPTNVAAHTLRWQQLWSHRQATAVQPVPWDASPQSNWLVYQRRSRHRWHRLQRQPIYSKRWRKHFPVTTAGMSIYSPRSAPYRQRSGSVAMLSLPSAWKSAAMNWSLSRRTVPVSFAQYPYKSMGMRKCMMSYASTQWTILYYTYMDINMPEYTKNIFYSHHYSMKIVSTLDSLSRRTSTGIYSVNVLGMHTATTSRYRPYQRSTVAPSRFTAINRVCAA